MNEISLIKNMCDQTGESQPTFSFTGFGTNWICIIRWKDKEIMSDNCTNKKHAKLDAARKLWLSLERNDHFVLKKKTCVFIDGDQRMDCWKYLADKTWDNMDVTAFVSPVSHTIECDNIRIIKSKTTSSDSADALILITLGSLLNSDYENFLIISSDHILVQAAMDHDNVDWVNNVKDLKEFLTNK